MESNTNPMLGKIVLDEFPEYKLAEARQLIVDLADVAGERNYYGPVGFPERVQKYLERYCKGMKPSWRDKL